MRILLGAHGFPPFAQGGAEIYAHDQARAFAASGDDVFVLTRESDPARPEFSVRLEQRDRLTIAWINNTFRSTRTFAETYANETLGAAAMRLIDDFAPHVAHFHHLTCLSTTIVRDLATRKVPTLYTLHDYWLLCHRGQLLNTEYEVCDGPEADGCAACLGAAGAAGPGGFAAASVFRAMERRLPSPLARPLRATLTRLAGAAGHPDRGHEASRRRLAHMREVIAQITHFLAPSRHMRDRFVAFGVPPDRITLAEYGFAAPPGARAPVRSGPTPGARPLRLGFLGSLMVSKAPDLLISAASTLPPGSVTIDLYGAHAAYHGDDSYRRRLEPLIAQPCVRLHGPLAHDEVPAALRTLDVLVVPSIWPENSPLVIREAFLAGVPVVASDIGGIPEAVDQDVSGLLFRPGDPDDLRRTLARLLYEPELLPALRRGIPPVRTLEADLALTRSRYEDAIRARRTEPAIPVPPTSPRLAAIVLNYRSPDDTVLAVRSLLRSRRPVDILIVVDNDSGSGCEVALAPIRDRIVYLRAGSNLGFSGGMNAGVREAFARGAERVLLVNSDVLVPPDCIDALEEALRSAPAAGIVGPVVLARHAPDRIASLGMSYRPASARMRHQAVGVPIDSVALPPWRAVDGVSGCLLLVTREVLDAVGLLDEDYFFGFEDLDLCLRARRRGWTTVLASRARAFHEGGRSIGSTSPARLYFAARNHLLLARRTSSSAGPVTRALRASSIIALNVAHAVRSRGGTLNARLAAVARGTRDYFSGRFGAGPLQ